LELIRLARPQHWAKSLLVFVPLITSHHVTAQAVSAVLVAFAAFCLASSAGYALNDLLDAEHDRHHPTKSAHPVAAGTVSKTAAGLLSLGLAAAAVGLSAVLLPPLFLWPILGYLVLTVVYSIYLKKLLLVDVLALTALYNLRIFGGAMAIGVAVSSWLLAFGMFFFTSIAFAKRYIELRKLSLEAGEPPARFSRRAYHAEDLHLFLSAGPASGYLSVLVLAMYLDSPTVQALYARPALLWLLCPLLFYWITRVWFMAHRGKLHYDPVAFVFRDRASWAVLALSAAVLVAAVCPR
jgi:4-hydroxybenzoate polyprenyltransferase